MIMFPCAKINLGLNIVEKRPDGYHNLETVFYPIPLYDAIEEKLMDKHFPFEGNCTLNITCSPALPIKEVGRSADNLVVKAYNMIAKDFDIPRIHIHLHKSIPMQAGLGGGSSDGAFMIRLLDERFRLYMGNREMERYAVKLGADCPFFITAEPSYATGIGEELQPVGNNHSCKHYLEGKWIALVKPDVAISTREAFDNITPRKPKKCCREIVMQPIETWKEELTNDFEGSIFPTHPELADIKQKLYQDGALYAQMSGSGSTIFGIYDSKPTKIEALFPGCWTFVAQL